MNWDDEGLRSDSFAKETVDFYSVKEKEGAQPRYDMGRPGGGTWWIGGTPWSMWCTQL